MICCTVMIFLGNLLQCIEHKAAGFSQWQQEDDSTAWWVIPLADATSSVHASFFEMSAKEARQLFHSSISDSHPQKQKKV